MPPESGMKNSAKTNEGEDNRSIPVDKAIVPGEPDFWKGGKVINKRLTVGGANMQILYRPGESGSQNKSISLRDGGSIGAEETFVLG